MKNLIYFIYTPQRFRLTLLNYYCNHKQGYKYRDNFNLTEAEKKKMEKEILKVDLKVCEFLIALAETIQKVGKNS